MQLLSEVKKKQRLSMGGSYVYVNAGLSFVRRGRGSGVETGYHTGELLKKAFDFRSPSPAPPTNSGCAPPPQLQSHPLEYIRLVYTWTVIPHPQPVVPPVT